MLQSLLHQQRQAVEALAHVGVAGRQPYPYAARDCDHRRRLYFASAAINAEMADTSIGPVIRIRAPVAKSISITDGGVSDGTAKADPGCESAWGSGC